MKKTGFTLVELLVVISVIGVLAALLMTVLNSGTKHSILQRAQSERDQIETAIQRYHESYGFYPPSNANASSANLSPALTNQLYYELEGTTASVGSVGTNFTTLDNDSTIASPTIAGAFGVAGFMNYTKGNGEDIRNAENFLTGLKSSQIATLTVGGQPVNILTTAAVGDPTYQPISGAKTENGQNANPWLYLYPGIHNPGSYDLWLKIMVGGKTNLISNWTTAVQIE